VGFVALKYFGEKAKVEERWLVERFGHYESYTQQVPRRVL
jgi:protein-S-isoprenylcysteine O-methyltransferase Ste14